LRREFRHRPTRPPPNGQNPPSPRPTHSFDETVDEHDSALELAEIMMSFGRTQGAAETLADYIRNNPARPSSPG
jgi:thioredoxin-like negative regulator of GroEL